jgi:hypothetical protein
VSDDPKRLVGGYATESLTEGERRDLLRAALQDQGLFDTLVEEEGLRELLADPAARERVLAGLDRPGPWERWRAFFVRPATLADLLAATAALVLALAVQELHRAAPPEEGVASRPVVRAVPTPTLERLAALPERRTTPASLEIEGAGGTRRVRGGQALAVRLTVPAPARVLLLVFAPDGSLAQAWPPPGQPPALLAAPAAAGQASSPRVLLAAPARPGTHRLRLVVAPPDLDLAGATPADVTRLAPRLTLVDLPFAVERP